MKIQVQPFGKLSGFADLSRSSTRRGFYLDSKVLNCDFFYFTLDPAGILVFTFYDTNPSAVIRF
tara:strand:- start:2047 stop:2238 length:192 start_codon:yes stop_codon:yes gene_type:complete